jgi:hypothetical protein
LAWEARLAADQRAAPDARTTVSVGDEAKLIEMEI